MREASQQRSFRDFTPSKIYGNVQNKKSIEILAALQGTKHVKHLSFKLGKTLISHEAISSFASFLMNNPNLQSLELNGNHWVDASQTQSPTNILKAVLHNEQSLTKLELSNLFFDEPDFIEAILATTQTLSEFPFHSSSQLPPVAYEVAQALSRGFRQNEALKTLDLR